MARRVKKFAEGGSDRYKARFDRKVADIESDFAKASRGKTGRDAEVARAKYEQRMADARDDLAKWTGADRTQTRAAEKTAERELGMTRRYGASKTLATVGDSESLAKPASTADIGAAVASMAPKQAAPTRKPAARRTPTPATPRRAPASRAPETRGKDITVVGSPKGSPRRVAVENESKRSAFDTRVHSARDTGSVAERNARLRSAFGTNVHSARDLKATAERNAGMRSAFAKGGKIDGCAVRGKTKAKRTR